jgi:amino acid adenylation domain-containing protein
MSANSTEQIGNSSTKGSCLSPAQERLWILEQLHSGVIPQNVARGLRWPEQIEHDAVENALRTLVERHEILRTKFQAIDGEPDSTVLSSAPLRLKAIDLRQLPRDEQEARLLRLTQQETQIPFDLSVPPLLRATLFQFSDTQHVLLLVAHRLVCDEASIDLLLSELSSSLPAGSRGTSSQAPLQYGQMFGNEMAPQSRIFYWAEHLAGAPASIELPTDRPRPPLQTFHGARLNTSIDPVLLEQLRALGEKQGATLFSTLLAAFNVLLSRYSRQDDIVLGTRVSGRGRPELEKMIGPLENLLALRTNLSGDPTFAELLFQVQQASQKAFAEGDLPFETLVKHLRPERDLSRHPIFQVLFTLQDAPPADLPDAASLVEVVSGREQFDLSVKLTTLGNQLQAVFSYSVDLFEEATIERMIGHFRVLLESAVANPGIPISRMPLLTPAERQQLLVEWNDTRVEYPRNIPLHQLIEQQVEKTPDAAAAIYESEQLSYRQLNQRANQLAHFLQRNGVARDVLVAVCAERSLELVIALLAILKAGGAYVPLDPEYPKDRLETMLRDANPPVILAQAHLLDHLPAGATGLFCLDRDWPSLHSESTENIPAAVGGKDLAYAIYTSGSTGKPKGVPNVHQGIVNRLLWMQDMYKLTASDRVLQKTPFSFDVSVWEFFWPLLTGAALVLARPGGHRDPAYLVSLIAQQKVTTLHFVPSMLSVFLETAGLERCRSVRQVFASGEALPFELQNRFFERMNAKLHNLYGPTEAAVDVTYWACRPGSAQLIVPIGRPIANTQIYILDANLQPVPIGVAAELHIGGIGLARGYLNRPELTAEKFILDPFSAEPGARLYKTGDLARFMVDGNIEYLGRIDYQVKLRGFRIELGEIETVLGECAGVLQAIVIVREDNPGDKRLVAYLLALPGKKLAIEALRTEIKHKLPEYMVPSHFIMVDGFPLTTSGKVDRKALPAPPLERPAAIHAVAPRNQVEHLLAGLFARVLGLQSVGVTDNFFDLGGHSLLAGRLLAQIRETTGRQIPLSALFRSATVESLARLIDQEPEPDVDSLVMEIQVGAEPRLPFFAIVPPGEESLGYAMLARHMGPEQTVYKIQGLAPVTGGKRPYSAQEMQSLADEYIAAMRSVQPHGPYCLGGFCDGTHIAEQIVLGLEERGENVALFAIFDTWVLQHSQRRWLWRMHYFGERLREMKSKDLTQMLASYKSSAANKVQQTLGKKPPRSDWRQAYWPEGFTPARFRAPVVLFKRPKQPFYYINDPQMGWGARTQTGVQIYEVDLNHDQILREPHVAVFGEKLSACMAQVSLRGASTFIEHSGTLATSTPPVQLGS